jgi:hypothetical protein
MFGPLLPPFPFVGSSEKNWRADQRRTLARLSEVAGPSPEPR